MARDDFASGVKDALAKRVSFRCSNPACAQPTSGPHSESSRHVNIGVASHITAASVGGPRHDADLSPSERSSIENAIWLCQNCAKVVDSDTLEYSVRVLRRWKVAAEAKASRALAGDVDRSFFPQPPSAVHAPVPRIAGLPYDEARSLLIDAGWQPRMHHWSHGSDPTLQAGNGLHFWEKGYWEIVNAWPSGLAHCAFSFGDVYGNALVVMTAGEVSEEHDATAHVWSWRFTREGTSEI
jgi:hypothetical protein